MLPLVQRTARALTLWLTPAYGTDLRFAPDLDAVEALAPEREALWARMERTSFLSNDEKRTAVGYGDKPEGGDSARDPFARKYREDQARDDQGRWVDEGGGEDEQGGGDDTDIEFKPTAGRGPGKPPAPPPKSPPPNQPPQPVPIPPGTSIRNKDLAGRKHPETGIPFDSQGFPDFSGVEKTSVPVPHSGNRNVDFSAANRAAAIPEVPDGWTWHHHQDGRTMQLVPRDVHTRTGHTGSIGINNLPGRKMERKSMLPTMLSKHKAVGPKELRLLEGEIGYALPAAYTAFLLSTNGGKPERDTFQITGFQNNPCGAVHFFFGLNVETWSYNLGEMYRWFAASVPTGILTIGCTAGADYICLDQRAGDDRVIYWDHRHHWGTGEWREQDAYPIAANFSDFLVSLRPNPYA